MLVNGLLLASVNSWLGNGSVGKVLSGNAGGYDFDPHHSHFYKRWAWRFMLIIPALGMERRSRQIFGTHWPVSLVYLASSRPLRDPV